MNPLTQLSETKENIRVMEAVISYECELGKAEIFQRKKAEQIAIIEKAQDQIVWLSDHHYNNADHVRVAQARLRAFKNQLLSLMSKKELQQYHLLSRMKTFQLHKKYLRA